MRSAILVLASIAGLCECRNKQQPLKAPGTEVPLLKDHIKQPLIGFGTWNLKESPENTTAVVAFAIETGYRQIDCAAAYGNENHVGKGIAEGLKKTGLKRDDIWVTSKLWNDHHAEDRVEAGLNHTLSDLGLDYLDLYLMHWPVGKGPDESKYHYDYLSTWKAMEKLLKTGRLRNIGISNFSPAQLKDLIKHSSVKPAAHQMELHPYLPQAKWVKAHQAHGITITAYSPLGDMNPTYGDHARQSPITQAKDPILIENEVIKDVASKRDCTPAQVVLQWGISRGTSVIPKSKHENWIEENLNALKCLLVDDDYARITALGDEPTRFNNPSKGWGVDLFDGLEDA